jgi:hypothetical protein
MMVRDGAVGASSGARVPSSVLLDGREERRRASRGRASLEYGPRAEAALDLLELLDLAWHDRHGEGAPPADVIETVWRTADGDLGRLASAARLAVAARG